MRLILGEEYGGNVVHVFTTLVNFIRSFLCQNHFLIMPQTRLLFEFFANKKNMLGVCTC